jgi:hypothetical protein
MSFQLLHFYYDAFIWRFPDPHIRREVGSFIFYDAHRGLIKNE